MKQRNKEIVSLYNRFQNAEMPQHLEVLTKIANGSFSGERGTVFRAFAALSKRVQNDDDRNIVIKPLFDQLASTIAIGSTVEIHNPHNALSEIAKQTCLYYEEIIKKGEQLLLTPPPHDL